MAEPTLALTYTDLASRLGDFAGYGRGALNGDPAWTTGKMARIDDCIRSGCRKVYKPTPPYDWSWLHLFVTLTLPTGATSVQLPDDCAGVEGDVIVQVPGTNSWCPRVLVMNPGYVRELYARIPTASGPPAVVAIEQMKGTTLVAGQREQMTVYPAADQPYQLSFQYYVVPDAPLPPPPAGQPFGTANANFPGIATGNPYVYGGAEHAELMLEACLSVFEERYDDLSGGVHKQRFMEELASSVMVDRRSKAQHLGRNYDSSDDREGQDGRSYPSFPTQVTYNGQTWN